MDLAPEVIAQIKEKANNVAKAKIYHVMTFMFPKDIEELVGMDTGSGIKATKWKRASGSLYISMSPEEQKAIENTVTDWEQNGYPLSLQILCVSLIFDCSHF